MTHNPHASPERSPPAWTTGPNARLRVVLLGAGDRAQVREAAAMYRPLIEQHAEILVTDFNGATDLAAQAGDLAIVFGGDGSILRAANQMGSHQLPVLGVNLGKLGFLADISPEEFPHVFPAVCRGECSIVEHLMFRCQVLREGALLHERLGLNEVSILAGPPFSLVNVDLYVDAELATTYSCDGLIISTPVGSTAHSLSAGGPILRKDLQAFVISPISPHTLTVRPVVDSADRQFAAVVREPNAGTAVVVDGRPVCPLLAHDRVCVERAASKFRLVEVQGRGYYRTLREKLGWSGEIHGQEKGRAK